MTTTTAQQVATMQWLDMSTGGLAQPQPKLDACMAESTDAAVEIYEASSGLSEWANTGGEFVEPTMQTA
jgi:hypothetical protein